MKVLFLNPIGQLGGAERGLVDLLGALRRIAPEISPSVVVLGEGPLLETVRRMSIPARAFLLPNSMARLGDSDGPQGLSTAFRLGSAALSDPSWLPRFAFLLRRENADIIHSNGLKTHVLGALARPRRSRIVWHLHDFLMGRPLMRRVLPALQGRAAGAIAVSDAVAQDGRRFLRRLEVTTVLNGIDAQSFALRTSPLDLDALSGLAPAPRGTVRIGLVATHAAWKGHDVFIRAADRLRAAGARFYVIGGPLYSTASSQRSSEELLTLVRERGISESCGLVPFQLDMARVYSALDIVVNASTQPEPFGRSVAEAMASGCPVVASSVGGLPEQVVNGVTGILVQPNDSDALAAALSRLLTDTNVRVQMGAAAKAHASSYLGSDRMCAEMVGLYRKLTAATFSRRGTNTTPS